MYIQYTGWKEYGSLEGSIIYGVVPLHELIMLLEVFRCTTTMIYPMYNPIIK